MKAKRQTIAPILFAVGLVLAASDGDWVPFPNLAGLALMWAASAMFSVRSRRETNRNTWVGCNTRRTLRMGFVNPTGYGACAAGPVPTQMSGVRYARYVAYDRE